MILLRNLNQIIIFSMLFEVRKFMLTFILLKDKFKLKFLIWVN